LVLPEGCQTLSSDDAERFELLKAEVMYAGLAMQCVAFQMLLFKLPHTNPSVLRTSLAKALVRHPSFAGRIISDRSVSFSGCVVLTNAGVPFTVVRSHENAAPSSLEEISMLSFGDFPRPDKVITGAAPVMTVKLTMFKDGSAILAVGITHALADGTYAWAFVADWAAAARGDQSLGFPVSMDRKPWKALLIEDDDEIQRVAKEITGTQITKRLFSYSILMGLMRTMDLIFFAGLSNTWARKRLTFSRSQVDHIKKAATPPKGTPGGGWVTTQEAVTAHILLSLGRAILPAEATDAVTGVTLVLDGRSRLGMPADAAFGLGATTCNILVERLLEKSLWEVALCIHDELQAFTPEKVKRNLGAFFSLTETGLGPEFCLTHMQQSGKHNLKGKYDLHFMLNNDSKRVLPDFGGAGGAAMVLYNTGPSLLLPAPGGVELFLAKDAFMGASSSKTAEAIELISNVSALPLPAGLSRTHAPNLLHNGPCVKPSLCGSVEG